MKSYAFDLESNGLLDELDTIHCLVIRDLKSKEVISLRPNEIERGLDILSTGNVVGHNIITFDIPAIQKVYPQWTCKGVVRDTMTLSRLVFPHLKDLDFSHARKNPDFPKQMIGRNSLESWGHRIGIHKGNYDKGWDEWNEEMQSYCEQDVEVTQQLLKRLMSKKPSKESIELEHDVAEIIWRQEQYGFAFNKSEATKLYARLLDERTKLGDSLTSLFPPWIVCTPFVPKRDNKTRGYKKGVTIYKEAEVEFNPNSRDHIALKLIEKYDWKPTEFTPSGKPKIDETTLEPLTYPEAKQLTEYLMLTKRLGQIAEGKNAWIKLERNGRMHGRINSNGAVTGRMTHMQPNMSQVPASYAPYGNECRKLFTASKGRVLVGCDADTLELRCLAAYMAPYDGGAYIKTVLEGDKSSGTDMHTLNSKVLGCSRDDAKTWFLITRNLYL